MKKCFALILSLILAMTAAAFAESDDTVEVFNGVELIQDATCSIDLDNDGNAETIVWTVTKDEYDDEFVHLTVSSASGESVTWDSGMLFYASVYASDLDSDGQTELFVTGDEMSSDYETICLRYVDNTLTPLAFPDINRGENSTELLDYGYGLITAFGDNQLTLTGSQDVLGTNFAYRVLTLSGDTFEIADNGLWIFSSDADSWQYRSLTLTQALDVKLTNGSEPLMDEGTDGQLAAGTKLIITASDKVSVAYFQTEDGQTGYFPIEADTERGWGMKVNGIGEEDLFESIPYAD